MRRPGRAGIPPDPARSRMPAKSSSQPRRPQAVVVCVDGWTQYGGSQYVDSNGTGRYQSYLCDEIVAYIDDRYPTIADRDHRAVMGKSSGGCGALAASMLRPDVFGACASHAEDAFYEVLYQPHMREIVRNQIGRASCRERV